MKRRIEKLVIVSDTHCGSSLGLAAPESKTGGHGNTVGFGSNVHQAWLWARWMESYHWARRIIGSSKAALLFNGDAIEGIHHRTEEITSVGWQDHIDGAIASMTPMIDLCDEFYVVQGTECHVKGLEDALAKELNAVDGKAKAKWLVTINGTLIDATHHMPATSRAHLEAGAMSIVMGNARINYQRSGYEVPTVYLRAHRHCGGYYCDGAGMFVVTGGWQFLTKHGMKVVPDSIPSPTVVVLDFSNRPSGSLPTIHELKHIPPQPAIRRT